MKWDTLSPEMQEKVEEWLGKEPHVGVACPECLRPMTITSPEPDTCQCGNYKTDAEVIEAFGMPSWVHLTFIPKEEGKRAG